MNIIALLNSEKRIKYSEQQHMSKQPNSNSSSSISVASSSMEPTDGDRSQTHSHHSNENHTEVIDLATPPPSQIEPAPTLSPMTTILATSRPSLKLPTTSAQAQQLSALDDIALTGESPPVVLTPINDFIRVPYNCRLDAKTYAAIVAHNTRRVMQMQMQQPRPLGNAVIRAPVDVHSAADAPMISAQFPVNTSLSAPTPMQQATSTGHFLRLPTVCMPDENYACDP